MSAGSSARLTGFNYLLGHSGESMTFRAAPLEATVDRAAEDRQSRNSDFLPRDMSWVEFKKSSVQLRPSAGEYFLDAFGQSHRIELVRTTDITYRCHCEMSEVPNAFLQGLTDDGVGITDDGNSILAQ